MFKPDTAGLKIWPLGIWVRPGLEAKNVAAVLFGSFSTIALIVFMSLMQPYILNAVLHIPKGEQGFLTGQLHLLQEIVTISLVGFMGAWSDRVGRRRVYVLGLSFLGLGYLVYPLATNELELTLYRCVFAIGAAAAPVMLSTTVQDTPQEISRGKWVGLNNICQGLGVLIIATAILSQLPDRFTGFGYDAVSAGQFTFWTATAFCIIAAFVLSRGIPKGTPAQPTELNVAGQLGRGLRAGWNNPRLALAFGSAFIGRGDLVVIGSFLTLWITQHGISEGMTTAESVARAGMLFGMVQIAALFSAFFVGMITDRVNRVTGLCLALSTAAASYTLAGTVDDPFGRGMIPIALFLGLGEISVIVTGGALLGQEADVKKRGAVVGAFNLMGGIGIMAASLLGGWVYDSIAHTAPFTMMGICNGLLLLLGLVVRFRSGRPAAMSEAVSDHPSP
jgi:MFS family permease